MLQPSVHACMRAARCMQLQLVRGATSQLQLDSRSRRYACRDGRGVDLRLAAPQRRWAHASTSRRRRVSINKIDRRRDAFSACVQIQRHACADHWHESRPPGRRVRTSAHLACGLQLGFMPGWARPRPCSLMMQKRICTVFVCRRHAVGNGHGASAAPGPSRSRAHTAAAA